METKIVVVTDDESLLQAMYVDGVRVQSDETIYASDIEEAAKGRPIMLSTLSIELPEADDFPKTLERCMQLVVA